MIKETQPLSISVVVPTFNGAQKIGRCLAALARQEPLRKFEIIVVNDGSTDNTLEILSHASGVKIISQANAGPAAARNRGAREAKGEIVAFTDDDCEPVAQWLEELIKPFADPSVVGTKGTYLTRQTELIARFVQYEYEDKYRVMQRHEVIDFIDTYSAAFRRDCFLQLDGYDTAFPTACAEDVELSYRMSGRGWKMVFVPKAIVYHQHPNSLTAYLKKKFKFAFWRVLAVKKNPSKALQDSHTPQTMKLQLLFLPALAVSLVADLVMTHPVSLSLLTVLAFAVSTVPFAVRTANRDIVVAVFSPFILASRSIAQFLGVAGGVVRVGHSPKAAA